MPVVHAHRGASAYAPENTLPAFRLGVEMHADGVENDIHYTADGVFVVCHDEAIDRTSNGSGLIPDMTLEQLRQYDFGCQCGPQFTGTVIPTLDEFLEVVAGMSIINIEIKTVKGAPARRAGAFDQLVEQLNRHACAGRTIFSSFNHGLLREFKERHPSIRTGLLYSEHYTAEQTLELVDTWRADAIHPHLDCIDASIVAACKEAGVDINVWTVDSPEMIERAIALDPTGIISNVPDRVLAALGR